jgi:hypothetical protein
MGTIDPMAFTKLSLEIADIPNWESLIAQPQPPQPDPAAQAMQAEAQMKGEEHQKKMELLDKKAQLDAQAKQQDAEYKNQLAQIAARKQENDLEFERTMQALEAQGAQLKLHQNTVEQSTKQRFEARKQRNDVMANQVKHLQKLNHAERQQRLKEKNGNQQR